MGMLQRIWGKRSAAVCMLLVCLCALVFPQAAYAAPAQVTLTVAQAFTKPASSTPNDTFTYRLTALEAGNPMPAGANGDTHTFTLSGTGSGDIGPMTYTADGIYSYEIKQVVTPGRAGYTHDRQVYTIRVYVTTNAGDFEAEVVVMKQSGSKVSTIKFENSYLPLPTILVDPPVKKTVVGNPTTDGTFTFKLEAADKSNPMPPDSEDGVKYMTIVGSGEKDFGEWNYTQPGVYYYTVSEVNTGEEGYTYDTEVYTITDVVKDEKGQLVWTRTVTNSAGKQVEAHIFINTYKDSVPPTPSPTPSLTLSPYPTLGTSSGPIATSPVDKGGMESPKTGDESSASLYRMILYMGGAILIACILYLIINKKRRVDAHQ